MPGSQGPHLPLALRRWGASSRRGCPNRRVLRTPKVGVRYQASRLEIRHGGVLMGKLDGKVALVTGSGRNIGRATVLKLAGEGAHVVVNARTNQAEADEVAREARDRGVKALAVIADVARKDQVDAMVARALSEFGRIDILINNAAIRRTSPLPS